MKRVSVLLIMLFLLLQGYARQLKNISLYDSLGNLLTYFRERTNDTAFTRSLKDAAVLCNKESSADSLVGRLIQSEDILLSMLGDSGIIGRYPYKTEKLLSLGETTLKLSATLLPEKENLLYAAALHNLGMFFRSPHPVKAGELFEKALIMRKKISGEEDPDYIKTLVSLAPIYDGEGKTERAHSMILQALNTTAKTKGKENNLYADELFGLANCCNRLKKPDSAALLYEQELSVRRKILGDKNAHLALYLCRTGQIYIYTGRYKQGFSLYREAATITEQTLGRENFQYAWCISCIGNVYYTVAEYGDAIPYFEESLEIERKLCDEGCCTGDIPVNLHDLATTYQCLGKYEKAVPLFQEAISLERANEKNNDGFAFDVPYLASLYEMMGKHEEAFNLINQTITTIENSKNERSIDYVRTLNFLGVYYTAMKKHQQAVLVFKKALQYGEEIFGSGHIEYAATLNNMAFAYKGLHMYDTAAGLISAAAAIRKNLLGDEHPYYASSLNDLGDLYMLMGRYDSAEILYTRSLNIRKKVFGEEHPDYIASLTGLALLDITGNHISKASDLLAESNSIALKHIAQTYTSLSEQEKIGYTINQSSQFSYLPSLLFMNSTIKPGIVQQVYTNELALKGMVLNDQQIVLNSIRKSNDKNALELYNEWRLNKIYIGRQLLQPINERSAKLDSLTEVTNQMEQELSRISVVFRQQQQMLTPKNISEKLRQDEAAIEFISFQYYSKNFTDSILYVALVVLPGDNIPVFVPLFEERQLISLLNHEGKNKNSINRFYAGNSNSSKQLSNSGDSLYRLIWKPLEKYLTGIHTIYYAPSGLLNRIAFNALPAGPTGRLLIDKYHLHQLLSTRSVALPSAVPGKPSAISIWGNIQYDDKRINTGSQAYSIAERSMDEDIYADNIAWYSNDTTSLQPKQWPALHGTRTEMNDIKNIFMHAGISVSSISDTAATEEAFKAMDGRSPEVLHIATHGFFWSQKNKPDNNLSVQQDPMFRSGLVLAGGNNIWIRKKITTGKEDGILTSYEIAQLNLSNTALVVLSACETALGDLQGNEGVIGLQRAFKLAGVQQMIISLWRVPDKQTAELMRLFYKNWLNGQSTHEALHAAQLAMKTNYPPYAWAGFVLVE